MKATFYIIFCILSIFSKPLLANEIKVIVTLKPLHSLVSGVMQNISEPTLLLNLKHSPHTFSLKPSHARNLQKADVIFWGGENMETYLVKSMKSLGNKAKKISLLKAEGIHVFPIRESQYWESHAHEHSAEEEELHDDSTEEEEYHIENPNLMDPHIWLDPLNAIAMVQYIATQLSKLDSKNTELYSKNAKRMVQRLKQLHSSLKNKFEPLQDQPYLVFHDGFQYLEKRYHLKSVGSVLTHVEHSSSVRQLKKVKQVLQHEKIVCVFSEPQFSSKLLKVIISGTPVKTGILDPVGADLEPGTELYFKLMENLSHSLNHCLNS